MTTKILLDHDIEGYVVFFKAGLQETGWDQYVTIEFLRLGDLGLSVEQSDKEIWRRVQNERLLFITNNRNREGETSLQAILEKESGVDSVPVLTISSVEKLVQADYRQQTVHKLAEIILYLERYLGVSRIYIPERSNGLMAQWLNSSSSAFASCKSFVSNPSVN